MKTIWGLLIVICFGALLFGGISQVNTQILANNGANLNDNSVDLISRYDARVQNLTTLSGAKINDTSLSSNQTNQVDAFFREAAETKNNIEKTRDGLNFIWDLPAIILLSIPFINVESNEFLTLFKGIVFFLLSVLVLFVLLKGIRGKVDNEV